MKYAVTGGAGHISKPLVEKLLEAGHTVTVIGRSAANLKALTDAGATAAIGSVEDRAFLAKAFSGADAIYTMVPPVWDAADWKAHIAKIGENYSTAIREAGVKNVVNLSSIGAHVSAGVGPVSGLYRVEQAFNKLDGVNVRHVRAAYFYQNLLSNIGLIKQAGIMGGNFSNAGDFPIVHPNDIADAIARELLSLSFTGHSAIYVASDDLSTDRIASSLGHAIGKPELKWVEFTDEQALQGMLQAGLSEEVSRNYVEMGQAMRNGIMSEDYLKSRPAEKGKIKIDDFAKEFAAVYNAQ